ncbi:uncharacterized protein LOC107367145 [Tetranychus urticae]|uniref:uncharacterized protein LOC107367145 n=1 Tax=Tetranychus urticae TaxID=32264 RepID=UPI00077BCD36|nr:uncharacterized protein LOC107367145 [Tetranychus urticae]
MFVNTKLAINKLRTSLPLATVRTSTISPAKSKEKEPSKPARPAPELPDIKKCCVDNGLVLDRCVDILCDPVRADEATITDIMICAPWANITFKCMASGIDHTDCCRERGVSSTCLPFCEGTVKRLDFRHFVCLDHMSSYSNCILDFHGVLSSPPSDFAVASVHHDWAVLKWSPPKRLGETILKYNIHWRESSKDEVTNYNVSIAKSSPYLLDGLKPGSRYEVYVSAENKYGASRGSSRVIFSTPPIEEPEPEEEIPKAYNETACCARAGMKSSCLPLCNYQMKVSDVLALAPTCTESISTLVRCGAGGRNHIPCCRRRGVALGCLNLCAGILVAYNMEPSKSHGIMLTFAGQKKTLKLSCLKLDLGLTQSSVYNNKNRLMTGSSIYMNGNLICTWIAQPFTFKQSPYAIELLDLVYNANYSLALRLDENDSIIAQDASELPWYQLGFTKCGGYQIYGDNEYQLIIKKKMNLVQFWINTFDKTPKFLRVSLSHESLFLNILCNYTFPIAAGYSLSFDGTIGSFTDDRPNFNKIVGNLCSVDLPDTFECKKGLCSIWDLTFDLDLSDDEKHIYSLNNLKLNESLSGSRSSCDDITFLSSFIIACLIHNIKLYWAINGNWA